MKINLEVLENHTQLSTNLEKQSVGITYPEADAIHNFTMISLVLVTTVLIDD